MRSMFGTCALVALLGAACAAPASETSGQETASSDSELRGAQCKLHVEDPDITYVEPDGTPRSMDSQPVQRSVRDLLEDQGFVIVPRSERPHLRMETEVRCGRTRTWVWWMPVVTDACQTEVRFVERESGDVLHRSRTQAIPGMNIRFDGIDWPRCKDL